jgi:group I intron endonuclease
MEKRKIYLVSGISGSGKSWVCSQLTDKAIYIDADSLSVEDAIDFMVKNKGPFLYDLHKPVSTFIRKNSDIFDICLVVILGDYLEIKSNLKKRNPAWTYSVGMKTRWNRMHNLSKHVKAVFSGSARDVLKFLKRDLDDRVHKIYKATSPSGKVYIGKTSMELSQRIASHKYDAFKRQRPWAFSAALRKYGDQITWEILVDNIQSSKEISFLEKKYIKEYQSTNPNYGYNLTFGGDGGGRLIGEFALKKSNNLKKYYASDRGQQMKEHLRNTSLAMRSTNINNTINEKVKQKRSSIESRKKTSEANKKLYSDPAMREKMSQINKASYSDLEVKRKVALAVRAARAKKFDVFKLDGTYVGQWDSASTCAEDLNISRNGISNCLHGRQQTVGGFKVKYVY